MTPAFELRNLNMTFSDQPVLVDANLRISPGECLVLLGPSGHGKTVLLKVLAGLIDASSGEAFIEGQSWAHLRGAKRLGMQKKIGMLFQKNALFDSLTCGENIAFPLRETTALTEPIIQEKVKFFLDAVGLPEAQNLFPDELSGGMQKRLGIARALALDPEIILYDDPTAGLDPITSRRIIELILKLKKEKNSTVVAITNEMNRAYQMGDRLAMVIDRELILTGTPEETKQHADPRVRQFIRGETAGPLTVLP